LGFSLVQSAGEELRVKVMHGMEWTERGKVLLHAFDFPGINTHSIP